eukprot:4778293-Lingulodinium_polyedra.AAC.1
MTLTTARSSIRNSAKSCLACPPCCGLAIQRRWPWKYLSLSTIAPASVQSFRMHAASSRCWWTRLLSSC